MSAEVEITRLDRDAKSLRQEAAKAETAAAARRMLAIALVLEGKSRTQAAEICGMDRQTLRDWAHRYNEEGIAGLADRARPGRPPRLNGEQLAAIAEWVDAGPDVAIHGIVRWRRIDLQRLIKERFAIELAEQTVGALLRKLGFRKMSARPAHPQGDGDARAAFKKTSPTWLRTRSRLTPKPSRSKSGSRMKLASANKAR